MASVQQARSEQLTNGPGAAALVAAGIGAAAVGILAILRDAFSGVANVLNFYNPSGPLSGVTTMAIVVWLASWFVLGKRWSGKDVKMTQASIVAFVLLAVGFALTFPPFMDLLQGK